MVASVWLNGIEFSSQAEENVGEVVVYSLVEAAQQWLIDMPAEDSTNVKEDEPEVRS